MSGNSPDYSDIKSNISDAYEASDEALQQSLKDILGVDLENDLGALIDDPDTAILVGVMADPQGVVDMVEKAIADGSVMNMDGMDNPEALEILNNMPSDPSIGDVLDLFVATGEFSSDFAQRAEITSNFVEEHQDSYQQRQAITELNELLPEDVSSEWSAEHYGNKYYEDNFAEYQEWIKDQGMDLDTSEGQWALIDKLDEFLNDEYFNKGIDTPEEYMATVLAELEGDLQKAAELAELAEMTPEAIEAMRQGMVDHHLLEDQSDTEASIAIIEQVARDAFARGDVALFERTMTLLERATTSLLENGAEAFEAIKENIQAGAEEEFKKLGDGHIKHGGTELNIRAKVMSDGTFETTFRLHIDGVTPEQIQNFEAMFVRGYGMMEMGGRGYFLGTQNVSPQELISGLLEWEIIPESMVPALEEEWGKISYRDPNLFYEVSFNTSDADPESAADVSDFDPDRFDYHFSPEALEGQQGLLGSEFASQTTVAVTFDSAISLDTSEPAVRSANNDGTTLG